jgi:hypothetical protein
VRTSTISRHKIDGVADLIHSCYLVVTTAPYSSSQGLATKIAIEPQEAKFVKSKTTLCGLFLLLTSMFAQANPVLITGSPSDSYNSPAITKPSPNSGGSLLNFDGLTPFAIFPSHSSQGITISSPDGLEVIPYSTQSGPNELFDNSSNGSASIFINLSVGSGFLGVGIADSDITTGAAPVTLTLQPLTNTGTALGSAFTVTIPQTGANPGNGYFMVRDTTADIFGLQISQPTGNANFSGLAIDDVQAAPEPSTFLLLVGGLTIPALFRLRKRA